ncbi:MAG TPA: MurR/RpiR family transcriptional regulator [Acidimicrobiales bacterium]|nr:MurR/RpiR family transcriptional regulator [Acidimicrobiales bacterium]
MPEAEGRVADAVLADPALVTSESVSDLAARAGSSTATVVRLCRRIGFDGFYRFKIALAEEAGMTRQFGHPAVDASDSGMTILESSMLADARDLADAITLVDQAQFDAATEAILNSTDVLFAGVGTSAPLAQLGALWFLVSGVHAFAVQDVQALDLTARLLRPGSSCVLISHTGSSKETVAIAKSAHAAEARTIAVTSFARSPLARACDLVLATGNRNDPRTLQLFTTRVVHVGLIAALHAAVSAKAPRETDLSKAVADVAGRHLY